MPHPMTIAPTMRHHVGQSTTRSTSVTSSPPHRHIDDGRRGRHLGRTCVLQCNCIRRRCDHSSRYNTGLGQLPTWYYRPLLHPSASAAGTDFPDGIGTCTATFRRVRPGSMCHRWCHSVARVGGRAHNATLLSLIPGSCIFEHEHGWVFQIGRSVRFVRIVREVFVF